MHTRFFIHTFKDIATLMRRIILEFGEPSHLQAVGGGAGGAVVVVVDVVDDDVIAAGGGRGGGGDVVDVDVVVDVAVVGSRCCCCRCRCFCSCPFDHILPHIFQLKASESVEQTVEVARRVIESYCANPNNQKMLLLIDSAHVSSWFFVSMLWSFYPCLCQCVCLSPSFCGCIVFPSSH